MRFLQAVLNFARSRTFRVLLLAGAAFFCLWLVWSPPMKKLAQHNPAKTRLMQIREQQARQAHRRYTVVQKWVPLSQIARPLRLAVMTVEDDIFFQHHGLDWENIWWSLRKNWKRGRYAQGGSTITQQVVKNLYLTPRKSLLRKLKEAVLALRLERTLKKKRILEIYLNVAEWGPGIFGAEAAARRYYHKPAAELTWEEAVALAAVLPSPLKHSPLKPDRFTEFRQSWIKHRLLEKGFLAPEPILGVTDLASVSFTAKAEGAPLPLTETAEAMGNTLAGAATPSQP